MTFSNIAHERELVILENIIGLRSLCAKFSALRTTAGKCVRFHTLWILVTNQIKTKSSRVVKLDVLYMEFTWSEFSHMLSIRQTTLFTYKTDTVLYNLAYSSHKNHNHG